MADNVLYFPYIRVPKNRWFTQVLLYWDQVGSIVPTEYIYHPESLGSYMRELVQAQLVKQVMPENYIHETPRFEQAFLELIDQDKVIAKHRRVALEREDTFQIHIEKFGEVLARELCDRGLARPAGQPWYEVEKVTASLFMAYLVSVLGKSQDLHMDPITDRTQFLSVFSRVPQNILSPTRLADRLRMGVLEGILPAPDRGIPVRELANFKYDNLDLLRRFRRHIEASLIQISSIPDTDMRNERVRLFKEESADERDEIAARMRERNWSRIVFGTFCALVAAMDGAEAIATGDIIEALKALSSLIGAIYLAFSGTPKQQEILRSPLAYAALAQQRLT